MSRVRNYALAAAAALTLALMSAGTAEAIGPVRHVVRPVVRPVVRVPVATVRTVRYAAPPYRRYVAPRVIVGPGVYVQPHPGAVIYVP